MIPACLKVNCIYVFTSRGAELDARDKDGLTPLMVAAVQKCEMTFDLMVQTKDGARVVKSTLLSLAQAHGQLQPISYPKSGISLLQVSYYWYVKNSDYVPNYPHRKCTSMHYSPVL